MPRIEYRKAVFRNDQSDELYDPDADVILSRVVGGMSPAGGDKPGGIVVLAEHLVSRPPAPAYVLGVYESFDLGELCRKATEYMAEYQCQQYYGNTDNLEFMQYLEQRNRDVRFGRYKTIHLTDPPYCSSTGSIAYFVQELKRALTPGHKTLSIIDQRLREALSEIAYEQAAGLKEADNPLVAALGYAFVQLKANPHYYGSNNSDRRSKTNSDPFRILNERH